MLKDTIFSYVHENFPSCFGSIDVIHLVAIKDLASLSAQLSMLCAFTNSPRSKCLQLRGNYCLQQQQQSFYLRLIYAP